MSHANLVFKDNIREILQNGTWDECPRPRYESDGEPAYSRFITQIYEEYHLDKGQFPITSLRPIGWKSAIKEILWIMQDQTSDLSILKDKYNIHWWDSWKVGDNNIGQRYGATVKRYDLINKLIKGLKENPFGRRHLLNLWQESDFKETDGLLPCAMLSAYTVRKVGEDYYLDATLFQRSSDYLVAGHINMIQYAALQMMLAHECNMKVGKFVRFTQNLHIYERHLEQAEELLLRSPTSHRPILKLNAEGKTFYEITIDDFELINYNPIKPQLKFDLGV